MYSSRPGPVAAYGVRKIGCLADSLSVIYRGHEFEPQPGHIAFMESDHEIISIFSLPLIQRKGSCRLLAKVYVCALSSGNH